MWLLIIVVVYAHVIDLPQGLSPGPTRAIYQGIQGDGMGSLLLGRMKFKTLFQDQWIGLGEFSTLLNHGRQPWGYHRIISNETNLARRLPPTPAGICQLCSMYFIVHTTPLSHGKGDLSLILIWLHAIISLQMHGWHTCNQQLSSVSNCALKIVH